MFAELHGCSDIRSLLQLCANFHIRATFLYRRVNELNQDEETGRNLGLYIGTLRECFCVRSKVNPLKWLTSQTLYHGALFPLGIVVDYARRETENIWWQAFTSKSADLDVACGLYGNILFEVLITDLAPSLSEVSAFPPEQEFILHPYQRFTIERVRWSDLAARWIIQVTAFSSPPVTSWFTGYENSDSAQVGEGFSR
jgi:hypothetical protein